jgi:hypothetical protein
MTFSIATLNGEYSYADCHAMSIFCHAGCCYSECRVIMLNVLILSVVMLGVVGPSKMAVGLLVNRLLRQLTLLSTCIFLHLIEKCEIV